MCDQCKQQFIIHNVKELKTCLRPYKPSDRLDVLKLWLEREYFTNLIYLEYLNNEKESH